MLVLGEEVFQITVSWILQSPVSKVHGVFSNGDLTFNLWGGDERQ